MPKVSRAEAEAHRQEILQAAAEVFRERGFDGVGVAELMAAVGLTHGGFYGHFESKEALIEQAFGHAAEQNRLRWQRPGGDQDAARARRKFIAFYLSREHRDAPGGGCPMAALAGDVARPARSAGLRSAYGDAVQRWAERLTAAQTEDGGTRSKRRKRALVEISALVGAVLLARATRGHALSDEILKAVRDELLV